MPNGLDMTFMPVCVSSDEGFFNWKKIKLGDPAGGFKEYPTVMALGGSFPLEQNGKRMWCYYMGKYEVTEQQYSSLMKNDKPSPTTSKAFPITNISWFDAIEFTNRSINGFSKTTRTNFLNSTNRLAFSAFLPKLSGNLQREVELL